MDHPHVEVEIKPQFKSRGSVTKKEDPKPQIKSIRSVGRFCVCGIYKRSLRVPTKENELILMVVNVGGKNTEQ